MEKTAFDWLKLIKNITRPGYHTEKFNDATGWDTVRTAIPITRDYLALLEYLYPYFPKNYGTTVTNTRNVLGLGQLGWDIAKAPVTHDKWYDALASYATEDLHDTDADKYKKMHVLWGRNAGFRQGTLWDRNIERRLKFLINKISKNTLGKQFYNIPEKTYFDKLLGFANSKNTPIATAVEPVSPPRGELTPGQKTQVHLREIKQGPEAATELKNSYELQNGKKLVSQAKQTRKVPSNKLFRIDSSRKALTGAETLSTAQEAVTNGAEVVGTKAPLLSRLTKPIKNFLGFLSSPLAGRVIGTFGGSVQGGVGAVKTYNAIKTHNSVDPLYLNEDLGNGLADTTLGTGIGLGTLINGITKMGPAFYASMIRDAVLFQNNRYGKPLANRNLNNYLNNRMANGNYSKLTRGEKYRIFGKYVGDELKGIGYGTYKNVTEDIPKWIYNTTTSAINAGKNTYNKAIDYSNQQLNKNIENNYKLPDGSYKIPGVFDQTKMVGQHMFNTAYSTGAQGFNAAYNSAKNGYNWLTNKWNNYWKKEGFYNTTKQFTNKQATFQRAIRHILRTRGYNI